MSDGWQERADEAESRTEVDEAPQLAVEAGDKEANGSHVGAQVQVATDPELSSTQHQDTEPEVSQTNAQTQVLIHYRPRSIGVEIRYCCRK